MREKWKRDKKELSSKMIAIVIYVPFWDPECFLNLDLICLYNLMR